MPNRHKSQDAYTDELQRKQSNVTMESRKFEKRRSEPFIPKSTLPHVQDNCTFPTSDLMSRVDKTELRNKESSKADFSSHKKRPIRRHHTIGTIEDMSKDGTKMRMPKKELVYSSSYSPTTEHSFAFKRAIAPVTEVSDVENETNFDEAVPDRSPRPSITYAHRPSKVNFQTVTNKVTRLLNARRAFLPRKSISKEEDFDVNAADKLPKTPRFSSSLSAEAQYALMKGYEDKIADTLTQKYPEFQDLIKRNKTPHHSIAISDKSWSKRKRKPKELQPTEHGGDIAESKHNMINTENETLGKEAQPEHIKSQDSSQTQKEFFQQSSFPKETVNSCLANLRRLSLVFPVLASNKSEKEDNMLDGRAFTTRMAQRSHSLSSTAPSTVPRERQILLSYRLERAMDLVDTMRPVCENTLSPRISGRREAPVVDYNHWADVWATEFETNAVN
ncbi:muscle M-line assembly protein unc-89 [Biomphalaria pfeifferi]|uniref:Muscle M-line assembly protein unc-89 n=1 Tax=Biomphalaria pfeifferi TaxID=112525 RepID=A0AAD8FET5_BIOPF|nr:muscle M-line assembly protein unc-89 [Biomphalaria pfeifferi]